nr:n-acetylglutamate synthase [uncultured Psychroserpens sp.]
MKSEIINLDKIKMNVIHTGRYGIVNEHTIFEFTQKGNYVEAKYAGGKVESGFLAGLIKGNKLEFNFCQVTTNGMLDTGKSSSEITILRSGKIRLIEHFEWTSRSGESGVNIFEEI